MRADGPRRSTPGPWQEKGSTAMNKSAGKLISDIIRERLQKAGADFCANDNIAEYLQEGDLERLQQEVEERVQALLGSLVIDT